MFFIFGWGTDNDLVEKGNVLLGNEVYSYKVYRNRDYVSLFFIPWHYHTNGTYVDIEGIGHFHEDFLRKYDHEVTWIK
jgi:hypothetical protein